MTSLLRRGLSALTLTLCLTGTAGATGVQDFVGRYAYEGSAAEKQAVNAAVERAAMEFNPIFRLVARPRLEHAAEVYQHLLFVSAGGGLGIQKDSFPMRTCRLDGMPIHFTNDGKATTMSRHLSGSTLVEVSSTEDGTRTMTFQPEAGGKDLMVSVKVESKNLKHPLEYTVTYHRVGK